jgi:pimeloyl-ACP methyl ester carboxylesterase
MIALPHQFVASADGTKIGYRTVGAGEPVVVVGGALGTAEDYMPLAAALAPRFAVHVIDRRGRGVSGPQGAGYSVASECDDLGAVLEATGATRVFGHSYGGLAVLEAAKRNRDLTHVAVYEPGVSVRESVPTGWIPEYARRLAAGDRRGAFAVFVRGSGHAPKIVTRLPVGYLRLVLRLAVPEQRWRRMEPLLEANLAEHEQIRRLDGTAASYHAIAADVLLLGGGKSPRSSKLTLEALDGAIPHAVVELMHGLKHNAPDEAAPERVAARLADFFAEPSS